MPQYSSTDDRTRIEELILWCKPSIERLAWKRVALDEASGDTFLEFDDYVQVGMIGAYKAATHLERCTGGSLDSYLVGAADMEMSNEYRRFTVQSRSVSRTRSLDAPIKSDSTFSLADVLPDVSPIRSAPSKRVRALNAAIRRLASSRQRAAVRRRHALPGYGFHTLQEAAHAMKSPSGDAVQKLDTRGRQALRKDARLCAVMGMEVEA